MADTQKAKIMMRLVPYLFAAAGIALAGSDTLHVVPASGPAEGWGTVLGLILSAIGWAWSHRSLARQLPGKVAQSVNVEEIAAAAATAAVQKMHEPGSHLADIVAKAAAAAAQDAGNQVVDHVRSLLDAPSSLPPAAATIE